MRARRPRPICKLVTGRPLRPTDHAPGPAQGPPKTRHRRRRRLQTQRRQKVLRLRRRTRGLLFELYQRITSLLPAAKPGKAKRQTMATA